MSASIRFLGFAVLAWAGVRAASLGLIPGTANLTPVAEAATPPLPAIAETHFTPPSAPTPVAGPMAGAAYPPYPGYHGYPGYPSYPGHPIYPRPVAIPYYYPVPTRMPHAAEQPSRPTGWSQVTAEPEPLFYGPDVEEPQPTSRLASTAAGTRSIPPAPGTIPGPGATLPPAKRFDRLELSAWALLRGSPGPGNLATGGTLGGSQVGGGG